MAFPTDVMYCHTRSLLFSDCRCNIKIYLIWSNIYYTYHGGVTLWQDQNFSLHYKLETLEVKIIGQITIITNGKASEHINKTAMSGHFHLILSMMITRISMKHVPFAISFRLMMRQTLTNYFVLHVYWNWD